MGRFASPPFDQSAPPTRPPSNGLGIAGFVVSIVGFLACPLIAPVGMIMSFVAMFREPRGFAIAGFVLGVLGSVWFLLIAVLFGAVLLVVGAAFAAHGFQGVEATVEMIDVGNKVRQHERDTGSLPAGLGDLSGLSEDEKTDPWGTTYVYERTADGKTFTLKSAGKDTQPGTTDDIELDQTWLEEP